MEPKTPELTIHLEREEVDCDLCLESIALTSRFWLGPKGHDRFGFSCGQCKKVLCYLCLIKSKDASCPFCRKDVTEQVEVSEDWLDFRRREWLEWQMQTDEIDLWKARCDLIRENFEDAIKQRDARIANLSNQKNHFAKRLRNAEEAYRILSIRHAHCNKRRRS